MRQLRQWVVRTVMIASAVQGCSEFEPTSTPRQRLRDADTAVPTAAEHEGASDPQASELTYELPPHLTEEAWLEGIAPDIATPHLSEEARLAGIAPERDFATPPTPAQQLLEALQTSARAIRMDGLEPELDSENGDEGLLKGFWLRAAVYDVPGVTKGADPEHTARAFLAQWGVAFGVADQERELWHFRTKEDEKFYYVHLHQRTNDGLPIVGGAGLVVIVSRNGGIASVAGHIVSRIPEGSASVTAQRAAEIVRASLEKGIAALAEPILGVADDRLLGEMSGPARLVWSIKADLGDAGQFNYLVDAEQGSILHVGNENPHAGYLVETWQDYWNNGVGTRLIYRNLPFYFFGSWPDTSNAVFNATDRTDNYFWVRHQRDGWDNNLLPSQYHRMRAFADSSGASSRWLHVGVNPNDPVYAAIIRSEDACSDVVAHEFAHGIQRVEGGDVLGSAPYQRLVVDEHISDVFGEMVEDHVNGNDWVFGSPPCAQAFRRLDDPEACPPGTWGSTCGERIGPAHFSNFRGNGHHRDAGVFNKAFYLLAHKAVGDSPTTFAGYTVFGIGKVDAARVWYHAMTTSLTPYTSMYQWTQNLLYSASVMFNSDFRYFRVRDALRAVGMWEPEALTVIVTDRRMALARLWVGSEYRLYGFYREPVSVNPRLFYRYKTCNLEVNCSWSSATSMGFTAAGVAAVVFNNQIWVFYKYDLSDTIYYKTINSNGVVSSMQSLPGSPTTDHDLTATIHNGELYVFWKSVGSGSRPIRYAKYNTSSGWTSSQLMGTATADFGPGARSYGGYLYVFHVRGTANENLRLSVLHSGSNISVPYQNGYRMTGSVSLEVHRNRLHIAAKRHGVNSYAYQSLCLSGMGCTYNPADYTQLVSQSFQSFNHVALYQEAGRLHALRDRGSNLVWFTHKFSE